jgi:hypothetical protein
MTGLGVTFPAIQDDASFSVFASYSPGYYGVPHSYVIGRDMVIAKDLLGFMAEDVLEGHLMDAVYMREPIDLEMVMDVSDSMNSTSPSDPLGDSKLTMMKRATTMITDLLNDHGQVSDRMGLVWFTDDASEYQNAAGQKLLPVQANCADLKAQIAAQGTGTCTAMGAGLQTAFDNLSSSVQKRFAVLCTDGMQNIEPKVTKVGSHYEIIDSGGWLCGGHSALAPHPGVDIASYSTCIHTIGVGITANYASLLQEIANGTNGFYLGTNDPENDLDLIYFVDLCNCLADGSPAVVHHNAGAFYPEECQAVDRFYVNRSVRKVTVMLSWKSSQPSNLTFWLHSPDGTLLDLHNEMKLFETHCLATIHLPRRQDGQEVEHVGEWRLVIRGETHGGCADYHAFVIAEDRETKYHVDFPRKLYELGDILPIKIRLTESEEPVLRVNDIVMEEAHLRTPLAELLAQFKVSSYELMQKPRVRRGEHRTAPILLLLKLEAMASDRRFSELLTPTRNELSLRKGSLQCKIGEEGLLVPVALEQSGLCSFKVTVHCDTEKNGPISRTDMVSVYVGPGKANPERTSVRPAEISVKGLTGAIVYITPRNGRGQLLGPGLGHEFTAMAGKQALEAEVSDPLDGTYEIELLIPKKVRTKAKEKRVPVDIGFQGAPIWKGEL